MCKYKSTIKSTIISQQQKYNYKINYHDLLLLLVIIVNLDEYYRKRDFEK